MNRKLSLLVLFVAMAGALLAFNNCGQVGFGKGEADSSASQAGQAGQTGQASEDGQTSAPGEENLGQPDVDAFLAALPPDEVTAPVPISELLNDPTLFERYKCPDSDGIIICHFPENVESQNTQCIGRPAVQTHYDHIRNYNLSGVDKSISDYLGPCRVAL